MTGLNRVAVSVAMYKTARTAARPREYGACLTAYRYRH